ncbi:MAG: EAL domain-containing protein [Spirochaetaceae bacterium]|nr:EAL domain-containing protein [Spirochaetaceae bacterium]
MSFTETVEMNGENFMPFISTFTKRYEGSLKFYVADTNISQVYFANGTRPIPFVLRFKFSNTDSNGIRVDGFTDEHGQMIFSFSMPISNGDMAPRYYAGCITDLKTQFPVLVEPLYFEQGYSYIFSRDGTIFFDSDFFSDTASSEASNVFDKLVESGMPDDELQTMKRNISSDKGGSAFYSHGGKRTLIRYLPLDTPNWFIFSSVPEFKFSSQVNHILFLTILMVAGFAIYTTIVIILIGQEMNERKKLFQKFLNTDPLTNGMSLLEFKRVSQKYISGHPNSSMLVAGIDISNFKIINDLYGFEKGSNVLILVHRMLSELIEGAGYCCRSNNDFFYVFLNKDRKPDFIQNFNTTFVQPFNRKMAEMEVAYNLSFTAGVYSITEETREIDDIIERVNYVHSQAKKENRVDIVQYDENMRSKILKIHRIQNGLKTAIQDDQFQIFLQPKYVLSDGKLIGAESLIRWNLNSDETLMPGDFIPIFEQNGFIVDMDFHVIELVCRLIRSWIDSGVAPIPVSINQSRQTLLSENYFDRVCDIIERYKIPHELLDMEITEMFMYEESDYFTELIKKMRYYGFIISIGDFGSKYSSLALLREIPADVIKVDRGFLYRSESNERAKTILGSIVQMARSLNMDVICEGVETKTQVDLLRSLNCYAAQGLRLGKPVSDTDFLSVYLSDAKLHDAE